MSTSFTIGHISDLHFSPGTARDGRHAHSIERLEALAKILNARELDRLVVTGDLTDRGDPDSLLQAREFLFHDFGVSSTERTGLGMKAESVIVVPGNHDAYDCEDARGGPLNCWQKSLANFNQYFPEFRFDEDRACRYQWLQKGKHSVFIASCDTCYLGDPSIESQPDIATRAISRISKVARGKFSCQQAEQLLEWFDLGMRGKLSLTAGSDQLIPRDSFAKSFKILAMHHYLFEPPKYKSDFFLKLNDRNVAFRNIAMADFDMLLCGHKHVADFGRTKYGDHFDRRARVRYLFNLFRRLIGIYTLPLQFSEEQGRKMTKAFTLLLAALLIQKRRTVDEVDSGAYIDALFEALRTTLEDPTQINALVDKVISEYDLQGVEEISKTELAEIRRRLSSEFSPDERKALATAARTINRYVKNLGSRPFIHSMAGSAAKKDSTSSPPRGFNIYSIQPGDQSCVVKVEQFAWDPAISGFGSPRIDHEIFVDGLRLTF